VDSTLSSQHLWLDDCSFLAAGVNNRSGVYVMGISGSEIITHRVIQCGHFPCKGVKSEVRYLDKSVIKKHEKPKAGALGGFLFYTLESEQPSTSSKAVKDNLRYAGCFIALPSDNLSLTADQLDKGEGEAMFLQPENVLMAFVTNCPLLHDHDRIVILRASLLPLAIGFIDVPGRIISLEVHRRSLYFAYLSSTKATTYFARDRDYEETEDPCPYRNDCNWVDLRTASLPGLPPGVHFIDEEPDPETDYNAKMLGCTFGAQRSKEFQHVHFSLGPQPAHRQSHEFRNYKLCLAKFTYPDGLVQLAG